MHNIGMSIIAVHHAEHTYYTSQELKVVMLKNKMFWSSSTQCFEFADDFPGFWG